MSVQTTFDQPQLPRDPSNKPERDVIFTANGSSKASRVIWRVGALIGMESMNRRPPDEIDLNFIDWPFSKFEEDPDLDVGETFDHHCKVVKSERPKYAVAPDIDEYVSYRDAIEWADELQPHCDTVIVTPKTVLPTDVPDRFRVGMPCQERYGPPPWPWTQYRHCSEVHLLGGSPVKHHEILKYYVPVESVDTSVPVVSAGWADYWNGAKWATAKADEEFFYDCLKRSYRNMRYSLNPRRRVWSPRSRNAQHDYDAEFSETHADADCWGPDEPAPSRFYQRYD